MKITLDSQEVEYHESMKLLFLHINEPFYSAGKMFAWEGNTLGLGINKKIMDFAIKNDAKICINVGDNPDLFIKSASKIKQFCDDKKSYYKTSGTELYIVQWSFLDKLED